MAKWTDLEPDLDTILGCFQLLFINIRENVYRFFDLQFSLCA